MLVAHLAAVALLIRAAAGAAQVPQEQLELQAVKVAQAQHQASAARPLLTLVVVEALGLVVAHLLEALVAAAMAVLQVLV